MWSAIDHGRRRVLHFNLTESPTAHWVTQQLRDASPHDPAHRFLIFDNDAGPERELRREALDLALSDSGLRRTDIDGYIACHGGVASFSIAAESVGERPELEHLPATIDRILIAIAGREETGGAMMLETKCRSGGGIGRAGAIAYAPMGV